MSGSLFSGVSSYETSGAFVMESIVIIVGGCLAGGSLGLSQGAPS